MKDEINHISQMLESVHGCFDEIWLTDTGSKDGSLEFAMSEEASLKAGCPVKVKTFAWIEDFAAARNFSMEGVTTDYVMWLDLDDRLSSREEFCRWRDHVMSLADFWLVPYNYAFDDKGNPVTTFQRERVVKTKKKFSWKFFIHEGMIAEEQVTAQAVSNWTVNHARTVQDYEKDFARNVSMLEKRAKQEELPIRLKFYYGKELFDKQRFQEAYTWLDQVVDHKELEHHDRIMAFEYLCRSCLHRFHQEQEHKPMHEQDKTLLAKCMALALQGATLEPQRAEFYCLAGDALIKMGREGDALPMYSAAMRCSKNNVNGFLFVSHSAYEHVPMDQIARIYFKRGDIDGAIHMASESLKKYGEKETEKLLGDLITAKEKIQAITGGEKCETDEIVFSCIPGSHPYEFDEEVYKVKGIGGSETALVEVAKHIKSIVGSRRVIVFNTREKALECESGVEYRPAQTMHEYFAKFKPELHIAWRHNIKLTEAKTFLWCHDLFTAGAEHHSVFDKHICLTEFHKDFVMVQQRVPEEKIFISRNGVNRERFDSVSCVRDENKIIFPSSPDRGLEFAIPIVEIARKLTGRPLELHVFYGIEHLEKYGPQMQDLQKRLKALFFVHPWIKYHGNVDQKTLAAEMKSSSVWLYPANFIESFCITAIEALYAGCFPLVREVGALKNTLKPFHDLGMAKLLYMEPFTRDDQEKWAHELVRVLEERAWEKINMDGFDYAWRGVAMDFLKLAGLETISGEGRNFSRLDSSHHQRIEV
jgi:glycosyltransferase involved in cell wall biosynthesis